MPPLPTLLPVPPRCCCSRCRGDGPRRARDGRAAQAGRRAAVGEHRRAHGEGVDVRPVRAPPAGAPGPRAARGSGRARPRGRERGPERRRAGGPGLGDEPDLRRCARTAAACGPDHRAGRGGRPRRRRRHHGDADRVAGRRARGGRRLRRARPGAAARRRDLRRGLAAGLPAGLAAQRHRAAHDLDAAPRRGGQAPPAAAGLRRLAAARGAAQPGHQRHRQRLAEPAADDEPAADVAADGGRRAHDDGGDLAAARGDRAADRAAVGVDDPGDREAVAGAVRRAVALHGRAERADRGGVHRARARHGVRAAGRGRGGVRGEERRAARRGLPVAVRLGRHHAVDDVPREPQLRRGRRGRRAARHGGRDDAGRGAGVHPVLPAVHAAAHAGGVDGEPAAVRRGLGRAGVRAARRARADPRAGNSLRGAPSAAAGWRSSTCRSATGPTSH